MERVLKACVRAGVAIKINAHPWRLDMDWRWCARALQLGCQFSINPDAHSTREIDNIQWGVDGTQGRGAQGARDQCAEQERFSALIWRAAGTGGGQRPLLGCACVTSASEGKMRVIMLALAVALAPIAALAQDANLARPTLLKKEVVQGMPRGEKQEVTVLTATFKPGDKTVFHTHRFPVTVYVAAGTFTLDLEGQPAVTVRAGEAYVEPPNVKMTRLQSKHDRRAEGPDLLRRRP